MKTLKCPECNKEILVIPDIKKMSRAIELHVEEHRRKLKQKILATLICIRIRNSLTWQTLQLTSEEK